MCGIFGIIGEYEKIYSRNCIESIKHRGPDDFGVYENNSLILGFRRLSIIDLSALGHQPMCNESGEIWIIFNGEIYNYKEIKSTLSKSHKFTSETDSEVLIHGYEEWGIDELLRKVNGMYSFCIFDKKKRKYYLVRDRIGKKPLYYYKNSNYISFASETKQFFWLKGFKFDINETALALWMGFPYLPDNTQTLIKNINKVPPASYLEIDRNLHITLHKYWEMGQASEDVIFDKPEDELEMLLVDAVKKRMVADVPVGVLLSGGLDSSLITAISSKFSSHPVNTINISFRGSDIDESNYADIVAKHCGSKHYKLTLDVNDIYKTFRDSIWIFDDLNTSDGGLFSTYLLSKKIREIGVKVVLVGEGADEIFAGYSWFQLSLLPFNLIPNYLRSWLYHYSIMRTLPGVTDINNINNLNSLLKDRGENAFSQIQGYEIGISLPNHYCMKVDKGTSAASLEARAPYMDYRIVELARKLKKSEFLKSSIVSRSVNEKYILRRIAEKYLPPSIYQRKKKGGMLPVYEILNNGVKEDRDTILANPYISSYFGNNFIERLIKSNPSNNLYKWQREWILWKSLIFSLWFDYYNNYGKK